MISAWLDLPVVGIFACLMLVYGATAALIAWLTFGSPLGPRIRGFTGIVAPYFTCVATLFALLTGFLAADVMDRNRLAIRAVQTESSALTELYALAQAAAVDTAPIKEALRGYVQTLVTDEWGEMARGGTSEKAEGALAALLQAVAEPRMGSAAGQAVHNGMITLALQAASARSDRLALNSRHSDGVKWATVLLLCLMTQIAIAMVHLEKPRAHAAALAVFTVAAVIALGMIAIQEDPFDGALRISPAPMDWLVKIVAA
jgi:hypothetical protein